MTFAEFVVASHEAIAPVADMVGGEVGLMAIFMGILIVPGIVKAMNG